MIGGVPIMAGEYYVIWFKKKKVLFDLILFLITD